MKQSSKTPTQNTIVSKNRHNDHFCRHLINDRVLTTRKTYIQECKKTKRKKTTYKSNVIWDYPAVAITSYDKNGNFTCSNYSRDVKPLSYNNILTNRLNSLESNKRIGDKRDKNIIGHCAEPHAANQTMNSYHKQKNIDMQLDEVYFSLAKRPRTMEVISICKNCKDTFPNLK